MRIIKRLLNPRKALEELAKEEIVSKPRTVYLTIHPSTNYRLHVDIKLSIKKRDNK